MDRSIEDLLEEPSEALYRQILLAARDLRRAFHNCFRDWGITGPQFGVLLGARNGGSISEIAESLLIDPTNVSRIIERMEAAGLVERYREADDRRVVHVRLWPAGEARLAELLPMHVARAQRHLGFLPGADREVLMSLLADIQENVREEP